MSEQSMLGKIGFRSGILGSDSDLAIAAPLANGDYSEASHTDASRIGMYFDRTPAAEKIGVVIMGVETLSIGVGGVDFNNLPIQKFLGTVNPQVGTSYPLSIDDTGTNITLTNTSPIALSLPNNLPVGFNVMITQGGAGKVTCTPDSGASVLNSSGFTATRVQYSVLSLTVIANPGGASAVYILMGDGV